MIPESQARALQNAAPFWMSLGLVPLAAIAAYHGGWTLFLVPLYVLVMTTAVDSLSALELRNADTETPDADLFWHRLIRMSAFNRRLIPTDLAVMLATRLNPGMRQ